MKDDSALIRPPIDAGHEIPAGLTLKLNTTFELGRRAMRVVPTMMLGQSCKDLVTHRENVRSSSAERLGR